MLDQRLAALGADARDLVQHGGGASLAASRAVSYHGEAVRLVADLLDEMEPGVGGRELEAALLRLEDELLQARLALGTLRHADHAHLCLLYTSDAADERSSVDLGGRRI